MVTSSSDEEWTQKVCLAPGGIDTVPPSFVRANCWPLRTSPSVPERTSKCSDWCKWMCLVNERSSGELASLLYGLVAYICKAYSGGPDLPCRTCSWDMKCVSWTASTSSPSFSSCMNLYRIDPYGASMTAWFAVWVRCVGRGDSQSCQVDIASKARFQQRKGSQCCDSVQVISLWRLLCLMLPCALVHRRTGGLLDETETGHVDGEL